MRSRPAKTIGSGVAGMLDLDRFCRHRRPNPTSLANVGRVVRRLACAVVCFALSGCGMNSAVLQYGGSPYKGCLLNLSAGSHACDAIDPAKPTVVISHGWNPLPKLVRTTFGQSGAHSIRHRFGDSVNVLSWDWNAVRISVWRDDPAEVARHQGKLLAGALRDRGVRAENTHFIGHSLGAIVVAQASYCLSGQGPPTRQLTLLDPPRSYHSLIFDELDATCHASKVENYWAPGISGYGGPVARAGVRNYELRGEHPVLGVVDLSVSNHVYVMSWYEQTMRRPANGAGFQCSFLCCGE